MLYDRLGAHPIEHEGAAGVHFAVWAPNARRVSVVGDFNGWDGRRHTMRKRVDTGVWEIFVPSLSEGTIYKYEIIGAQGTLLPQKSDPVGFRAELRPSTASIVCATSGFAWSDGEWMARRGQAEPRRDPDVHLRSASRIVAARRRRPLAHVRRARRHARALRGRHGLHARRAAAGERASARRVVGLPADRPLRADEPLRRAGRVRALRRCLPPRRARRDSRLGARALPGRSARPRAVRRHRTLRARGPAPGLPSGLEHRDLRLRAARGRQLPDRERAVLARPVSHRRPAGRRRRVDALPRLLAQAGRVGAESLRRQREHRGDRVPAQAERGRVRPASRRAS